MFYNINQTLMVSYDLRKPGRDYSSLYTAIKGASDWAHPLESVWLIKTNQTPEYWRDYLRQYIDGNDRLLVIPVSPNAWASYNLDNEVVGWMRRAA